MEAMAMERVLALSWEAQGYFTRLRLPLQTTKGGWTDLDVVGFHPTDRVLRIGECKFRGPARTIWGIRPVTRKNVGEWVHWAMTLDHLRLPLHPRNHGRLMGLFPARPRKIEVVILGNWWIPHAQQASAKAYVTDLVRKVYARVPAEHRPPQMRITGELKSGIDVILELWETVAAETADGRGRRFGDPLLDALREIVRHLEGRVSDGGRGATALARKDAHSRLSAILGESP